jgi:2-polyprenyl-6-methoxyphenol hydroxylase-like FAD-dependent oxidoreductase
LPLLLRTIVIVGGGFCGVVLAANILRRPPPGPTRLVLIELSQRPQRRSGKKQEELSRRHGEKNQRVEPIVLVLRCVAASL